MGSSGLEGVVAATTRLRHVDGLRGDLLIAGFPVGELAEHASFEETTWLLWHGDLPSAGQLETFRRTLASARVLPDTTLAVLRDCARHHLAPMDALRIASGTLSLASDAAPAIVSRVPTIVAAYWRLLRGQEPFPPATELGHAANLGPGPARAPDSGEGRVARGRARGGPPRRARRATPRRQAFASGRCYWIGRKKCRDTCAAT